VCHSEILVRRKFFASSSDILSFFAPFLLLVVGFELEVALSS
jgi:hypothetical protein